MRILIEASVKLSSDDTVQRGQRSKQETKREPCPRLSFVVLVCSRLSSGNLDPGPDLLHRRDNLEGGQTERQLMVRATSPEERGTLSPMSTMPLAPHVHNQSHQSRGERQSRSSKHRKLEKEQPVHLQSMREVKKGSKCALENGSSNLMLSSSAPGAPLQGKYMPM